MTATNSKLLAERFEANRGHLRSVAHRLLGSQTDADDAVQATFLRIMRAGDDGIDNLRAWLTTITARVCLDMLRQRKLRSEVALDGDADVLPASDNPEGEQLLADSIGVAMLIVLETLTPAERVAFVLHDMFDVPFDEIAPIVGRSPAAARQLASRARRRVRGASADPKADRERKRELVAMFLAASQSGDLSGLLAVLAPDVVLRADDIAVRVSGQGRVPQLAPEIEGRDEIVSIFRGRLRAAQLAWIDGDAGLAFALGGEPRMVVRFALEAGRIVEIRMIADPHQVAKLQIEL